MLQLQDSKKELMHIEELVSLDVGAMMAQVLLPGEKMVPSKYGPVLGC